MSHAWISENSKFATEIYLDKALEHSNNDNDSRIFEGPGQEKVEEGRTADGGAKNSVGRKHRR